MKVFPLVISPAVGVSVTLYVDGTCQGNPSLLALYLGNMLASHRPPPTTVLTAISYWLMLRALQEDTGIERGER